MLRGGARGQYPGHHTFCLIHVYQRPVDGCTYIILGVLVQCDTNIDSDLHFMVL